METQADNTSYGPRRLIPLCVLAAELGVRAADLRREALAGRIPCVRLGERSLLFDRERVRRLLTDRAELEGGSDVH